MTNQKLRDALQALLDTSVSPNNHRDCVEWENAVEFAEQALSEPDWQPIETAPKGGTEIECWHKFHKCVISGKFLAICGDIHFAERTLCHSWPPSAFTHWRPKSQPPTQDK